MAEATKPTLEYRTVPPVDKHERALNRAESWFFPLALIGIVFVVLLIAVVISMRIASPGW